MEDGRRAADGGEQVMKAYLWPVDGTPPPTTTPSRWRRFVELQATIEAIDRAIEDEEGGQGSV